MPTYALNVNGRVWEPPITTDYPIASAFPPDQQWLDCSSTPDVAEGWIITENAGAYTFSAPPPVVPSPAQAVASLAAYASSLMLGGVMFQASGATAPSLFATDAGSLSLLQGSMSAAQLNLWPATKGYKAADGVTWVPFTAADVIALATKVFTFFAQVTSFEEANVSVVQASPATDISTLAWPSNA